MGGVKKLDVGEIISDALRYSFSDWKKLLIEGFLLILNLTVILAFGVGYVLRVMKSTLADFDELPEFDDWGGMLIDGFKVYIVGIVYFIIPIIVILVGVLGSAVAIKSGNIINPSALVGLGLTFVLSIVLVIIFGLFARIAIVNMAFYDELGAAFKLGEIFGRISKIGWGKYIIWYIVMGIVTIVIGIIGDILRVIPYLGFIVALLVVYSYLAIFTGRSTALIFKSGEEVQKKE
jgi:hypothetical protein